jgi:hypothetical protein
VRAKLLLNGHDRFSDRLGSYFNLVQPYQHHTNVPATGINVYSFALKPEEHQPSGTCNFSRIDNATLQLQLTQNSVSAKTTGGTSLDSGSGISGAKVRVYAVNYNVLRIMSGINGIIYSNLYQIVNIILASLLTICQEATILNCWNLLRASTTKFVRKLINHSKNVEDWTISSQAPNPATQGYGEGSETTMNWARTVSQTVLRA